MLTLNKEINKIHKAILKCKRSIDDVDSVVEHVRGFHIPDGDGTNTIGDLINKTPKN